jgi:hypothetical protein
MEMEGAILKWVVSGERMREQERLVAIYYFIA